MTEIKSLALSELSGEEFAKKLKELLGNREGGVFDLIWGPELEFEIVQQNEEPPKNNLD